MLASLNGQILPIEEAKISPMDRGFLFGDGIYEVVRLYQGRAFLFAEHLLRLKRSLDGLNIQVSMESIEADAQALLKQSGSGEGILYIQVSRGVFATRKHPIPKESAKPTVFMFVGPYDDTQSAHMREFGGRAVTYPDVRWKRVDLKTVNLLGNVLAATEAQTHGVYEAIFINHDGTVTEGSHTNIFGVVDGYLRTYPLSTSILPGVTRGLIMQIAKEQNVKVREVPMNRDELFRASEVFASATTAEILPIIEIDGKKVGDGIPGSVAKTLLAGYRARVNAFLGN